jgi:hypothetical protein
VDIPDMVIVLDPDMAIVLFVIVDISDMVIVLDPDMAIVLFVIVDIPDMVIVLDPDMAIVILMQGDLQIVQDKFDKNPKNLSSFCEIDVFFGRLVQKILQFWRPAFDVIDFFVSLHYLKGVGLKEEKRFDGYDSVEWELAVQKYGLEPDQLMIRAHF